MYWLYIYFHHFQQFCTLISHPLCKLQYQLPWNLLRTLLQCNAHKISGSVGFVHVLTHMCLSGKWHDASTCSLLQLADSFHSYLNEYEFLSTMHIYVCMYNLCCAQLLFWTHITLEIISLQFLAAGIRKWDSASMDCDCRFWSQNTGTEYWRGSQITCFPLFFIRLKLQITACLNSMTIWLLCHRFGRSL